MNCIEWETRVALHSGGDLAGAEAAEVERHLGECSGCQVFRSGLRESLAVLRAAHAEEPAAAHCTLVRSRVMAELERAARPRPWRRPAWIWGAAAAVLLAVIALWPARTVPDAPRLAARIPAAPEVVKAAAVRPAARRTVVARARRREPLTIKLQTADPNIVIYWIAD